MAHGITTTFGALKANPNLFDGLTVPESITKDVLINRILVLTQDMEVLYSDPYFYAEAITSWSLAYLPIWEHLYDTTQYEYNPINNYDRTESTRDDRTYTPRITETQTESGTSSVSEYTAGFNSTDTAANTPKERRVSSPGDILTTTRTGNDTEANVHTSNISGNIGVTTTQQMIEQERAIAEFNLIEYIANAFKNEFCLMVY